MDLADNIRRYFFDNFDSLPPGRAFHFASRLAAWEGSDEAIEKLRGLKSFMLPGPPEELLAELLQSRLDEVYAASRRRKYFEEYPLLHGVNSALFRIRHLKEVYGVDLREELLKKIDYDVMVSMADRLIARPEALMNLSSFAVNYLYLLEKLYDAPAGLSPELFLKLYDSYDLQDPQQLNLLIYMFTHCIIAESNYYIEEIPTERLGSYQKMIALMHELMERPGIKLDARLEYLVASRICHLESPLQTPTEMEMTGLLGSDGYIIDKQSQQQNSRINSLAVSEHRNVLFIMSTSAYRPHKILLN